MRVAVIGVGAIGGPIVGTLTENNINTTAVTKHSALAEQLQTQGLILKWKEQTRAIRINAVPKITDLTGIYDVIFLAMKATSVCKATSEVLPFMDDNSVVVTLQNGVVEDDVGSIVGRERVIGAVTAWTATVIQPGVVERTSDGVFYLGRITVDDNNNRLEEVAELLGYCQPVRIMENIYQTLYGKLWTNAAINGLGAISGYTIGQLLDNLDTSQAFMTIGTEIQAIAEKLDITQIEIGPFRLIDIIISKNETSETLENKRRLLIKYLGPYEHVKSSTFYDLERGRSSEIEYLNGYIANTGKKLGIPTPLNANITQMVKEIEEGKRPISPQNLTELLSPKT
jgi:2-dehydropantoate 2-reductase